MSQLVKKDSVVGFTYTLKDSQGEILDESLDEALEYLHGHRNIVKGLETALEGLKIGDKAEVKVSPEDGYGLYQDDLIFTFGKDTFPPDLALEVGAELEAETPEGPMVFVVKELKETEVVMDANHPLAGEELFFTVEIKSIREAAPEELQHGHVHQHGHHHH